MRNLVLVSAVLCLLSACQSDDAFVGQWVGVKNDCATLEVVKNGDALLANIKTPNIFMGGYSKMSVPAVVKDGVLSIHLSRPVVMTIDEASKELVGGEGRYRRPNGSEKCAK